MTEEQTPQEGAAAATPEASAPAGEASSDDRTMAMLAHLLGAFTWIIGPLIIWMMKRESSPFVDDQGKEAVNFQLTATILYLIAGPLTCVGIGLVVYAVVPIVVLVFCIIAALSAQKGERYRYPLCLRLIK